ncbi:uncharacterized protein LOC143822063 isoform X2 [Paroedura picta]|uniref:uncharacterized protein LOC143822063 isoform X2 n=1 Tax=Paroedura picta TaxID=143630 RepID=UPI004057BCCE
MREEVLEKIKGSAVTERRITFLNRSMGTNIYKGRATAATKMERNPASTECSSAQIIRQPRIKKSIQKRQIKSRFSRRRPISDTTHPKKHQGRSQDSNSHKRLPVYSQKKRLKIYYSSLTGRQAKFPAESRTDPIPPKISNKQGPSNSPGMKVEDRNSCSNVCRTVNSQPSLTERSGISCTKENQRSKLTAVEKRRYQTVSEYQFIYPGKAMFYCTKESVKQQLRSIYLGPKGRKSLKPTHQSTQMPHSQRGKNETQWENTKTDASYPVGSGFLRSKCPSPSPHGLTSLMRKISKLSLVNEKETESSCAPAGLPCSPQLQHQPPPLKSSLPAEISQRQSSSKGRRANPEGPRVEQEYSPDLSLQGARGNVLKASLANSTKPRPLSAKNCCERTLSRKPRGEDNQNRDSPKKEEDAKSTPGTIRSSKHGIIDIGSTAIPASPLFSSKENMNVEVLPDACSSTTQSLAEERQREPFPVAFHQPSAREEKISGTLVHSTSGQKRQAYSFITAGSKQYEPMSVNTGISLLD